MKMKRGTKLLFAIFIMAMATLACEFSFSTAEITNVYMSFDENGTSPTTVFGGADIFYCIVETSGAPDSTVVKVEWYAVEIADDSIPPNYFLNEAEFEGNGIFTFSYEFDYLWPPGLYRVDVYLDGEYSTSANFNVSQ